MRPRLGVDGAAAQVVEHGEDLGLVDGGAGVLLLITDEHQHGNAVPVRPRLGIDGATAQVMQHGEDLGEEARAVDADELEQAEPLLGRRRIAPRERVGGGGGERRLDAREQLVGGARRGRRRGVAAACRGVGEQSRERIRDSLGSWPRGCGDEVRKLPFFFSFFSCLTDSVAYRYEYTTDLGYRFLILVSRVGRPGSTP